MNGSEEFNQLHKLQQDILLRSQQAAAGLPSGNGNLNRQISTQTYSSQSSERYYDRPAGPPFPEDYSPKDHDICSGRGKKHWNLPGNIAFRNFMQGQVDSYRSAQSKNDKSAIVDELVQKLREKGCQFLKQNKEKRWYDIGDAQARDKVGHCLRDLVSAQRKIEKEDQLIFRKSISNPKGAKPLLELSGMDMSTDHAKPIERRNSFVSDSGNEAGVRRMSLITTNMHTQFARRPSWVAAENDEANDNWEYLDAFDDQFDQMALPLHPIEPISAPEPVPIQHPPVVGRATSPKPEVSDSLLFSSLKTFDARMSEVTTASSLRRSNMSIETFRMSGRTSLRRATNQFRLSDLSVNSDIFADLFEA